MWHVSVDVGGTFTDLVAMGEGRLSIKVPTTPSRPEEGVLAAFEQMRERTNGEVASVAHATTIATNALFGQVNIDLPRLALITTSGFKDVLAIGRQNRPRLFDVHSRRLDPLVPRELRSEVDERIGPDGTVQRPLKVEGLESLALSLERSGAEMVAICLINAFANPVHEDELERWMGARLPDIDVVSSHDVCPEHREFERMSTTVIDAILRPVTVEYFRRLESGMRGMGIDAPLMVLKSDGGLSPADCVSPAGLIESGPAAGVVAAARHGVRMGWDRVLTFDMGGTTAKAGVANHGRPEVVTEYEVGGEVHVGRAIKGSGYPVRFPFIDLAECSAGGGSIAKVDIGRSLRVGPLSAGAVPGPACYGRGGGDATITDANLSLGRLPSELAEGFKLDRRLAQEAIECNVGKPLGLDVERAALDMIEVVNSLMSRILRIVTVERGLYPKAHLMVAFGGAGPLHACELAAMVGCRDVLVPGSSGLLSAEGQLHCPVTENRTTPFCLGENLVMGTIEEAMAANADSALMAMSRHGLDSDATIRHSLDMRYRGQSYEIAVPVEPGGTMHIVKERFRALHLRLYGHASDDLVEVVCLRSRAEAHRHVPEDVLLPPTTWESHRTVREVIFDRGGRQTPIFDWRSTGRDVRAGPMVIEDYGTTVLVPPGWTVARDAWDGLWMRRVA